MFAVLVGSSFIAQAEEPRLQSEAKEARARMGEIRDEIRFQKEVDRTTEVYGAISKGSQGEIPASIQKNANCIAVLPGVITGAILVGGTRGEGLASCKMANNTWSQPAPVMLTQGSIGLQAGVKSADLVLFFQNEKAVKALKSGTIAVGTDISAVAGNYDSNVDTSNAGIVVYSRAEGIYAGASVSGSVIGKNPDELTSYYGKAANHTAILEGREMPDTAKYSEKLTKLFPR